MKLKSKIVFSFTIILISVLLTAGFKKIKDFEDNNLSVIVEDHKFIDKQNKELLKNEDIVETFKANNNNLGTISVNFNTHSRINNDYLQFSVKEKSSNEWYYTNKYKVDQFKKNKYFPFGFPPINNSKGKTYQIRIESLNGKEGNSVQVAKNLPFLSRYSFPKSVLLQNKKEIPIFLFEKAKSFFDHISLTIYLLTLTLFFGFLSILRLMDINKLLVSVKKIETIFIEHKNLFLRKIEKYTLLEKILPMFLRRTFNKIAVFCNRIIIEKTSIPIILLISTFSAYILYKLFFAFSNIIWSQNLNMDINTLSPQIRSYVVPGQRDGIETYVLYILIFVCIALTVFFVRIYDSLRILNKNSLLTFLFFALTVVAYFYYSNIGFSPPMSNRAVGLVSFAPMAIVIFILSLIIKVAYQRENVANLLIIILLLPICFIATSPISPFDYSFIFSPALRLLNHFEIKDIYFQYDMLLSFIAALWMKLGINLNYFQIVGQLSFYTLFLASFFFSKRFFIKKQLSYYLLTSLVLVKIYALMGDPIAVFQITPLRLDWWLLALMLSFTCGIYNKILGIVLGLLIIFHHTFGLIYATGYVEIISILFLFDFIDRKATFHSFKETIKKHFYLCLPNIGILALSFVMSSMILGGISLEAASTYQKIGVGFMPISTISFYWYFPVLVSTTCIFLMQRRKKLPTNYFNSSLLLIALSIGNSIYFFGRSHENNIINISASLIFVLFLFFDLILFQLTIKKGLQSKWTKILSVLLPGLTILLITFFYSAGIIDKSQTQFANLQKHQIIYPMPINLNIKKVRELTNNSNKVYFTGDNDFYYYYYGNYIPEGHYSSYASWVYKKDMISFMQNLLDKEYYIVSPLPTDDEVLSGLRYNKSIIQDGFKVIWNF